MTKFIDRTGDLFASGAYILVNTVNCVGVMGKGIALQFKQRYPDMFYQYQVLCKAGKLKVGNVHIWEKDGVCIINFPTKNDWRNPSQYEWIEAGLKALRFQLKSRPGTTIAIPALGCSNGGLDWDRVKPMIVKELDGLDVTVMLYAPYGYKTKEDVVNYKFYTGIGSRQTPPEVLSRMTQIATWLEEEGYILRSGGAEGADSAFESGIKNTNNKRIFLPWKGFNESTSGLYVGASCIAPGIQGQCTTIASKHHPKWNDLSEGQRKLFIRNVLAVIGDGTNDSKFIVCWTPKGKDDGGTGHAMRVAQQFDIPIINLNHFADDAFDTKEKLMEFVNSRSLTDIRGFYGKYAFLSNMQFVETPIEYDGKKFHFVETAFQYAKHKYLSTDMCIDVGLYKTDILRYDLERDPYAAKKRAKDINPFLTDKWHDSIAYLAMQEFCAKKFLDYNMRLLLLSTGSTPLIESNVWKDTFWGVYKGQGKNQLGGILIGVRASLKTHPDFKAKH